MRQLSILYRRFRAFAGKGWVVHKTQIVTPAAEHTQTAPIFIIGTHRSGTSQLRRIVDSHHQIACPPESFFLKHISNLLNDNDSMSALDAMGFSKSEILKALRETAGQFHRLYAISKKKNRWADKTPQYVFHLESLLHLFGSDARFLFIVRHPLDVAYSIWSRKWLLDGEIRAERRLEDTCSYVHRSILEQRRFWSAHPGQCLVIHYDTLNLEPEKTLRSVCEFLDEPFDDRMLHFNDHHHDFGTEDPIARGTRGFEGSFENWMAWSDTETASALNILEPCIRDLGYSLSSARRTVKSE